MRVKKVVLTLEETFKSMGGTGKEAGEILLNEKKEPRNLTEEQVEDIRGDLLGEVFRGVRKTRDIYGRLSGKRKGTGKRSSSSTRQAARINYRHNKSKIARKSKIRRRHADGVENLSAELSESLGANGDIDAKVLWRISNISGKISNKLTEAIGANPDRKSDLVSLANGMTKVSEDSLLVKRDGVEDFVKLSLKKIGACVACLEALEE